MCSRPKLTVLETILLSNACAAKRAYALLPCSRLKLFGGKAIRLGNAPKPNDFAPIQFAAASPKMFSACCKMQRLLAKSFDRNAHCSMLSQKFWACCKMQRLLAKKIGLAAI